MQSEMLRKMIILAVIIGAFGCLFFVLKTKERLDAERRDNEFDAARNEYKAIVENPEFYTDLDIENVKYVEVKCDFIDEEWSSYTLRQITEEQVTVYLNDEIDSINEYPKCEMFISIANNYISRLKDAYKHSRYLEVFNKNRIAYTMDYKGKEVEIDHYYTLENFTFKTENRTYSFEHKNRTDGRYRLIDKNKAENTAEFYVFFYYGESVDAFEKESSLKARTGTSKKSATTKKDKSSTSKGSNDTNSKSDKRKTYDPYDIHNYKSAQDFADDKYEEFYDYEDDFEDEDEAYDAAEDYWNDNH